MVVFDGREVTLAQCGPSVAYGPDANRNPRRFPAESPWLRRNKRDLENDLEWPPLGMAPGDEPVVHWERFDAAPGTMLVAATTRAAEHLDREVVGALFATPATRAGNALGVALPENIPAIILALPGEARARAGTNVDHPVDQDADPGEHSAGSFDLDSAAASASPEPTAAVPSVQITASERLADSAAALRDFGTVLQARSRPVIATTQRFGRKSGRSAARVLVGLLPSRTADGVREEWSRLTAAIALGLPLAVLAFTAFVIIRAPVELDPNAGAPAQVIPPPDPPANTASDSARGIRRLEGADLVAVPLTGNAGDEREIVATPGGRYVLNRELSLVERIDAEAETPVTVLERGSVVNGEVVGVIEDLFWLPGAADGEAGFEKARAVALDGAGRTWALEGDTAAAIQLGAEPRWRAVSRAAGYKGAIYALDRAGDIFRYDVADVAGPAPAGTPWLSGGADLDGAIDLAIDGGIWVLFDDGTLTSYVGGKRSFDAPLGMPTPLRDARSVFTAPEYNRLLVPDAGSGGVIVLDGSGRFVAELRLPTQPAAPSGSDAEDGNFTALHSVWWEPGSSTLWIVAGDVLFKAPFDG